MANLVILKPSEESDFDFITQYDNHISSHELKRKISNNEVLTIRSGSKPCGFLRYSLFWDNTPFLNMIYLLEEYRGKGFGKLALASWERKMQLDGYELVLTSTLSNEYAQNFYRSQGYKDCGSLLLEKEPLEIIFMKKI